MSERIVTQHPLYAPDAEHSWQSIRESYEGGDPVGFGATPEASVADLLAEEEWRAA